MAGTKPYTEHRYRSADERLTLFARDYPAARPGEELPALLLMHGLTRNSADFEPLIAELGDLPHRMIVPDQRGRGLSDHDPDAANYRPDVYVADVWKLLDDLGIARVICIGTSMGGLMAMIMGAQQPDRIAGIGLNDVGPEVSEEGLDRIRRYVGPSEPMADWQEAADRCEAINATAMLGFGPQDWMAFAHRTCHELSEGRIVFAYDPAIANGMAEEDTTAVPPDLWPMWDLLSEIPILSLRGAISDILTSETVDVMAERHPERFARAEIPDRGHAPILDEPAAVAAIREFLDRIAT